MIPDTPPTSLLEQAVVAIQEGRKKNALEFVKQELSLHPDNVFALLTLAQISEDFKTKELCFRSILKFEPDNLQAQIGLSALELTQVDLHPPYTTPGGSGKMAERGYISLCPACGVAREDSARFCGKCGHDFAISSVPKELSSQHVHPNAPVNDANSLPKWYRDSLSDKEKVLSARVSFPATAQNQANEGGSKAIWGWILLVAGFAGGYFLGPLWGFFFQFATLIMSIVLIRSTRDKTQGLIILIIWLVLQIIGFLNGLWLYAMYFQ